MADIVTTEPRNLHRQWDTELCVLSASSRDELIRGASEWMTFLGGAPGTSLADAGLSMARTWAPSQPTLAIVATSVEELARKLSHSVQKLSNPDTRRRIRDKSGIFYTEDQLARGGKLAFLFPGEGSQYANMLRELCLHFPEARSGFDAVDQACRIDGGIVPSADIFPPGKKGATDDGALWEMEAAIEAVSAADIALMRLMGQLKLDPQGVVGHSSGEFVALEMAGVVRFADESARIGFIRDGYIQLRQFTSRMDLPEGTLLTVGGVERAAIERLLARHAGQLLIAIENCPHQYVLCAQPRIAGEVSKALAAEGGIVIPLPFHRPYHTPWFESSLDGLRAFFGRHPLHPPRLELYSCATAARFPADPEQVRRLCVDQWAKTIRFPSTIEAMYADGYRIFVEVGPRGNLTAFVGDILKGRPHLAVACNRAQRSSLTHLQFALGELAAHGVPMDIKALFLRRGPRLVGPAATPATATPAKRMAMKLSPVVLPMADTRGVPAHAPAAAAGQPVALPELAALAGAAGALPGPARQVLGAYLDTMEAFVSTQREIMTQVATHLLAPTSDTRPQTPTHSPAILGGSPEARPPLAVRDAVGAPTHPLEGERPVSRANDERMDEPPPRTLPMLGEITDLAPRKSLVARRTFDVKEDLFLRDHTLAGTSVSVLEPDLIGLPIMPMTMSLEIIAEAAAALIPGMKVIGLRDVRANRWISFEDGRRSLRIEARRTGQDESVEVHVAIREDPENEKSPFRDAIIEATAILAGDYPAAKAAAPLTLRSERPCDWTLKTIYPKHLFHGPRFQGVLAVTRWGENGIRGLIEVLPRAPLFASNPSPAFAMDPVLLDSVGAPLALWGDYEPFKGKVFLPFRVTAIRFFGPLLPEGTKLNLHLEIVGGTEMSCAANIQAFGEDGHVAVEVEGWEDRVFDVTPIVHRMFHQPVDNFVSEPFDLSGCPIPFRRKPVCCLAADLPLELFETSHRIWEKMLAFNVLNEADRQSWKTMEGVSKRKAQWLLGRAVAKDAVRRFLMERHGLRMASPDIRIGADSAGKPLVRGPWMEKLPGRIEISLAHSDDLAAACAGDAADGALGIDVETRKPLSDDFMRGAFSPADRAIIDPLDRGGTEWALRAWCAKEALSKALGIGMRFDARKLALARANAATGTVELRLTGGWAEASPRHAAGPVNIWTFATDRFVLALCSLPAAANPET